MKIGVIGGGIAGIVAAELLAASHEVTLIEASDRLGGHALPIQLPGGEWADTLFQIFNERSYPSFLAFLERIGARDRARPMTMSFSVQGDHAYGLNLGAGPLLANAWDPRFARMLAEILRFRGILRRDLARGRVPEQELGDYLRSRDFSAYFSRNFIAPLAASVWSCPPGQMLEQPAPAFLAFLHQHGYLAGDEGRWLTFEGSSRVYLEAFQRRFRGTLRLGRAVRALVRAGARPELHFVAGDAETFDHVVVATHADQALRLLAEPSEEERALLGAWSYRRSPVLVHDDPSAMPRSRALWASWNVRRAPDSVTYWLNRVQGLGAAADCFVSMGEVAIREDRITHRLEAEHPIYDFDSVRTQPGLPKLNGRRSTSFCGSYFGHGFHEDATRSALEVSRALGGAVL